MVEGLAPPTRAVVHSHATICRRLRIQYVFLHMWCKPVLYYCLLRIMTLKWIRRWARFLDVKLRLDHTLSQSTDKLRSDNSLLQIVLIERGFVMQSIILLYIKETDGRPADGAIQSRIGWEEIEDTHGTPYALRAERNWRKTKYADAGRQNLVLNVWNEQRPWLSYISPHVFTPKEDQEGPTVFQILIELATTGPNL